MDLRDTPITGFSAALASKAAVPGGGGASALAGALAADLGHMVGALTAGKKKYAAVEEDIQSLMRRAEELSAELLRCIDDDAAAFEPLSRAYGIPKDDPSRDEVMEKCLREAASVPLRIFDLCCDVIDLEREFAEKGSVLAVSDAATGAALARGALMGAAVNVKVNTKSMKDREYAANIDRQVDERMDKYMKLADEVFDKVYGRFC
jgi:formiminotetrahydrofolate cyclodeaminase